MGVMVILTEGEDLEVRPDGMERLAGLGVTTVSMVSGEKLRGVVLQGWSFDARSSADEAAEIVSSGRARVQLLVPTLELVVRKTASQDQRR